MNHKQIGKIVSLLLILSFAVSACSPTSAYAPPISTNDGWQTASLEEAGLDEIRLQEMVRAIQQGTYQNVHSILIVKDGRLVFEKYFDGYAWDYEAEHFKGEYTHFDGDTLHYTMSVTKSITSALVGIAIDQSFIQSKAEKMFTYFPEYEYRRNKQNDKIALEHLLSMTSGLAWNEWEYPLSDPRNDLIQLFIVPNPVDYILTKPVIHEPGTHFYYNGGGVNILGEVIQTATGKREDVFAQECLFEPLGITAHQWEFITEDMVHASGNLQLRPRDMAKFGQLYLDDGEWNGEQIISEAWVKESTRRHSTPPTNWADGYGYLWWLNTYQVGNQQHGAFFAEGWGGQRILVIPDFEMVVVLTGGNYESDPPNDEIIERFILPAILDSGGV